MYIGYPDYIITRAGSRNTTHSCGMHCWCLGISLKLPLGHPSSVAISKQNYSKETVPKRRKPQAFDAIMRSDKCVDFDGTCPRHTGCLTHVPKSFGHTENMHMCMSRGSWHEILLQGRNIVTACVTQYLPPEKKVCSHHYCTSI